MTSESSNEDRIDNFHFPTITHDEHDVHDYSLSTFPYIEPPRYLVMPKMTSMTDDVESLSSMNESAWDMIDERSAASDNDVSNQASRIATPMSEAPEPIYPEAESLAGNDTSSESQEHHAQVANFSHSRKDSSSDPPDTARPLANAPKRQSILLENQTSYIKFQEADGRGEQEASFLLTEFNGTELKKIAKEYSLSGDCCIAGTVRQRMGPAGILPSGPFKVIYVGPVEMKETLVNKIASALAASPGFSPRDPLKSSRVTVVPISSFADDSSPDVVLIDSMGIDMNIEECKSAKEDNQNITLVMTNHSRTYSTWNKSAREFQLPQDYDTPDLAVVYVPQRENSAAKMTRSLAKEFFSRHHIPILLVSYDTKWKELLPVATIDQRLPHLSIEAFRLENDNLSMQILRRQAIDISTFISIDSAQLSRSLALIVPPNPLLSSASEASSKLIAETPFIPTLGNISQRRSRSSGSLPLLKIGLVVFSVLAMLILRRDQIFQSARQSEMMREVFTRVSEVGSISSTSPTTVSSTVTVAVTRTLLASQSSETKDVVKIPVTELLKDNLYQNNSDKFQAQAVGDSHIILRAPTWFSRLRTQPKLKINVHRSQKAVPHEFSTLFNGVYALKFPPEHAHGSIEITLSSTARPKVHEVFNVDMGNPWLKISGLQRAALAMKDHLTEDLFSARVSLLKAYSHTNTRVQYFFKDAVTKADSLISHAEKASLGSLTSSLQNTDQLLSQTKALTLSLTEKLRAATISRTPAVFGVQHESLVKDLSTYSKKISTMFTIQARSLTNAASGLVTLGQDIQSYRETHFVDQQKRLLQTWWSVFGIPSHLKAEMHKQARQDLTDESIWGSRSSARRAARRARREMKREARQNRKNEVDSETEDDEEESHPLRERYRRAVATVRALKRNAEAHFDSDSDSED